MRGYFEIGVWKPKSWQNIGSLWRSAYQMGAAGIFTIGARKNRGDIIKQASDTTKAWRHLPLRQWKEFELDFLESGGGIPYGAQLIGIEFGKENGSSYPLSSFIHPERAVYLLGAEDHGLSESILNRCASVVEIDGCCSERNMESFNVAVAGSIVMWHRNFQQRR